MEEKGTGKKYRMTKVALTMAGIAVLWQMIEYVMKGQEIEFRFYLQVVKGIYLWLVVPITVVFAIYCDFFREKAKVFWRYLFPTVLTILILAVSFFRGSYFFFCEMITEERMENGMIRGMHSSFLGSRYIYYEPAWGIFRKRFQGWSQEEIEETVKRRYGEGIVLLETEPSGTRVYRAPGAGPGKEPFEFWVKNNYEMEDNYVESLIQSNALAYWPNRQGRKTYFSTSAGKGRGQLTFPCYSMEDVTFCASDIADWVLYVLADERYPDTPESEYADFTIWVDFYGARKGEISLNVKRNAKENDWEKLCKDISEKIMVYAKIYWESGSSADTGEESGEEIGPGEDAAWEERFLADYHRDDYEKEVFLQDGMIGYRMVVLDAALGSRMYGLIKSTDGGESWQVKSRDPFGESGMGIDFTFLDEDFGFATLMHNGGDEADLFVTENGGESYERCVMQGFTVALDDGYVYDPYDYPGMPYEEEGVIYVLCGQGADGDYDGGDRAKMALYRSADHGHTFVFQEMKNSSPEE